MTRPMGIPESLYQENEDAVLVNKMHEDDCANPALNTITPVTLSTLMSGKGHTHYIIVDCRFDYEFEGGHINGALNMNDPNQMEETFFSNKDMILDIMTKRTAIIFHCEFSQ